YPYPAELEQRVGLHHSTIWSSRLITFFTMQLLARPKFFHLASNPRSRAKSTEESHGIQDCSIHFRSFTRGRQNRAPSADVEPDDSVSLAGRPAEHRLVSVTDFFRAHSLSDLRRGAGRFFTYRDPAAHTSNE